MSIRSTSVALFVSLLASIIAPQRAEAAPRKLVFKEETVIEGEVQKPEVAVFISRQNLNKAYELTLNESFLPKIIEALEHPPF
jgi:hypothetical protein